MHRHNELFAACEELCALAAQARGLPAYTPYIALGATTALEIERLYFPFRA